MLWFTKYKASFPFLFVLDKMNSTNLSEYLNKTCLGVEYDLDMIRWGDFDFLLNITLLLQVCQLLGMWCCHTSHHMLWNYGKLLQHPGNFWIYKNMTVTLINILIPRFCVRRTWKVSLTICWQHCVLQTWVSYFAVLFWLIGL